MTILWFPRFQFDIEKFRIVVRENMCAALERTGQKVDIAISGSPGDLVSSFKRRCIRIPQIKIKFMRLFSFWFFGFFSFINAMIRLRPDVVMVDIYSFWFAIPAIFFFKKSLFIMDNRTPFYGVCDLKELSLEDGIMKAYSRIAFLCAKKYLHGITVITKNYRDRVSCDYKISKDKIGVWGSGIDLHRFVCEDCGGRQSYSFGDKKFIVFQHGDMTLNRGLIETIRAMKMVSQQDVSLMLIGDGGAKERLTELVRAECLEGKVLLGASVPNEEIPSLIATSNCAIMAYPNIEYWNNNNPIKLLEYLAMGKVVICTDMWTFRDVLGNSKCAVYIKDNTPESIAKAIEYCYENRAQLKEWGALGRDIVRRHFTWDAQAVNLISFIDNLKNNRYAHIPRK